MAAVLAIACYDAALLTPKYMALLTIYYFTGSSLCFLVNDIFDAQKDVLNGKLRPIATGALPKSIAWFAAAVFLVAFVASGYLLHSWLFFLAFVSAAAFLFYSPLNNRMGLVSNVFVAFWACAPIWETALITNDHTLLIYTPGILALVAGREILLDWLDIEGDQQIGKNSIPIQLSERKTLSVLGFFFFLGSIILLSLPFCADIKTWSTLFLLFALATVWTSFYWLRKKPSRSRIVQYVRISHLTFLWIIISLFTR